MLVFLLLIAVLCYAAWIYIQMYALFVVGAVVLIFAVLYGIGMAVSKTDTGKNSETFCVLDLHGVLRRRYALCFLFFLSQQWFLSYSFAMIPLSHKHLTLKLSIIIGRLRNPLWAFPMMLISMATL